MGVKKSILLILIGLITAAAIFVGAAYAVWNVDFTKSVSSGVTSYVDDIAENYSFTDKAKQNDSKTYTIYLFPSAVYLDWYSDYLEENTGGSTALGAITQKPEEIFGCVEAKIDNDGNVTYNYDAKGYGDDGYLKFMSNTGKTTYVRNDSSYDTAYVNPYSNDTGWNTTETLADGTSVNLYDYGDPTHDQTQVSYSDWTNDERHNYRNLHAFDRLGYWSNLARGSGRYLPMKITVDATVLNTDLAKIMQSPLTDMGDGNNWYCFSFTGWSYCKISSDNTVTYPYYASSAFLDNNTSFTSKTMGAFATTYLDNSFDVSEDFAVYADADGVIRLFPTFSQGKTYGASSFENGGGDAFRIEPTYATDSVFNQHDVYLSYLNAGGDYTSSDDKSASGTRVAAMLSVDLSDYTSFTVQFDYSAGNANWVGTWYDVYTVTQDTISAIEKKHGEGLYNIYLFISGVGVNGDGTTAAFSSLLSDLADGKGNTGTIFPDLTYKTLFASSNAVTSVHNRTFCIAFEKIYNVKMVSDLSYTEETATSDDGTTTSSVTFESSYLQSKYNSSDAGFKLISLSENLYAVKSGENAVLTADTADTADGTTSVTDTKLQIAHPYCYLYYGLDFTSAQSVYFQVKYQALKRSDLKIAGYNDSNETEKLGAGYDVIYDPDDTGVVSADSRFTYAIAKDANDPDGYFTVETCAVSNSDVPDQEFFKLKNSEMHGIFDILIVEDLGVDKNGDALVTLYVYAYMHTQTTVKILANDVKDVDDDGFADHEFEKGDAGVDNLLIFQKDYSIGVSMSADDLNEYNGYDGGGFTAPGGYIDYSSAGDKLASCVNDYIDALIKDSSDSSLTYSDFVIRDHVTGAVVAYYNDDNTLTFYDFQIRKTYIFYIGTKTGS